MTAASTHVRPRKSVTDTEKHGTMIQRYFSSAAGYFAPVRTIPWERFRLRPVRLSFPDSRYELLKALLDVTVGVTLLILLAPLLVLLGVLVKLTSPGPVLYSQVRLGKNGRPYWIYKFRTMIHDCERLSGPQWASRNDPRITLLGRFLRAAHLDELPQLINILKGEMSLVGPRPERPEFVRKLEIVIPRYRQRLEALPGVTGLAQVYLPPDTDLESVRRKLAFDYYYLQQKSLWLDLKLIAITALQVVGVPFPVSRALFLFPPANVIETWYEAQTATLAVEPLAMPA